MMRHGKYLAEIEYDGDAESFYGRTVNVRPGGFDFWGDSGDELRREFAASADAFEAASLEGGVPYRIMKSRVDSTE